ncbi:MAG TPA: Maf family protein [Solirubrobacteraceae bacterium]
MTGGPRLVLASGSPQRRAILETLGVDFVTCASGVAELDTGEPAGVALENAVRKAQAVAARVVAGAGGPGAGSLPVLGVDTLVALESPAGGSWRIYGKPTDEPSARATLEALSGRTHVVISGVAVLAPGRPARSATVATSVRIRELDTATIDWYVAGGEWRGRAGGYAIQGRGVALVAGIDGDYSNVVGLPVPGLLGLWPDLLIP